MINILFFSIHIEIKIKFEFVCFKHFPDLDVSISVNLQYCDLNFLPNILL
jgi:hypothetical protein